MLNFVNVKEIFKIKELENLHPFWDNACLNHPRAAANDIIDFLPRDPYHAIFIKNMSLIQVLINVYNSSYPQLTTSESLRAPWLVHTHTCTAHIILHILVSTIESINKFKSIIICYILYSSCWMETWLLLNWGSRFEFLYL